jgi:hypothetical protein
MKVDVREWDELKEEIAELELVKETLSKSLNEARGNIKELKADIKRERAIIEFIIKN